MFRLIRGFVGLTDLTKANVAPVNSQTPAGTEVGLYTRIVSFPAAVISGGLTTFHLISAATTNPTVIKNSPGQVYGWYIFNNNANIRKIAFHNSASAPTAGASVFFSLVIPANSGANVFSFAGIPFSAGIAITTTTGMADNDAVAVSLNDLDINIWYK